MKIVTGLNEKGTTVIVDETSMIDCKFEGCTLIYCGGDFAWINSSFVNCTLSLQGAAARTQNLLHGFGWKPAEGPSLIINNNKPN